MQFCDANAASTFRKGVEPPSDEPMKKAKAKETPKNYAKQLFQIEQQRQAR
jgi:hypothetical protein